MAQHMAAFIIIAQPESGKKGCAFSGWGSFFCGLRTRDSGKGFRRGECSGKREARLLVIFRAGVKPGRFSFSKGFSMLLLEQK